MTSAAITFKMRNKARNIGPPHYSRLTYAKTEHGSVCLVCRDLRQHSAVRRHDLRVLFSRVMIKKAKDFRALHTELGSPVPE